MAETYILSIDDFTNRVDISDFIRTDRINQYIGITQDKYAVKMLCKKTYDELIDQLSQGGESYLDTEYAALLPFVKNYLIYKTVSRYLVNSNFISTAAGMRKQVDTISEALDSDELSILRTQAESDASFYQDELQNFLIDNSNDYPLWKASQCNCNYDNFSKGNNQVSFSKPNRVRTNIKWT